MSQLERLLAALSVLLVFLYVLLRAVHVPTFHDEAATFFHYVVTGRFLPYNSHWDANNHFLNSALAWLCYRFIGPEQIWIRLPNVLSFLVYGYFAVRISFELKNGLVRWLTLIAILTAAFPLEFFALARGYAMSLAFLLAAVFYATRYLRSAQLNDQLMLWFWMILAVAASLTLTNTYLIFIGLVFLAILTKVDQQRWNHLGAWFILGVSVFAAVTYYGFELKDRGLLYTGLADGFIQVTVRSLVRYQLIKETPVFSAIIAVLGALCSLILLLPLALNRLPWTAIRLSAFLLLFNAVGSILLNLLFGMNFPENRVGMYYIPLFIFTVGGALDHLSVTIRNAKWASLLFLFFPIHLLAHFNFNTTILWPKWHASDSIYAKLLQHQRNTGEPLMISAEYLNELGWAYYNFQNNSEMQLLQRDPVPDTLADMIIARPSDFDFASIPYDTMYHDHSNDIYLLSRTEPIDWSDPVAPKLVRSKINGSDEFYELLNDSLQHLPGNYGMFQFKAVVTCRSEPFQGQLVISSEAPNDQGTYNAIPMHWIRSSWQGDTLMIKRTYYFSEQASIIKVYFWNIHKQELNVDVLDLQFSIPE
ncbi:MAG: hypothetical protein RL266_1251 [Bacteroidota bacterium]|jgi:hypothetical protein